MRHNVRGRKLGRTSSHRRAMFHNQLASLVESERIRTTLEKAKELRPIAEKMITQGKRGTVHARRQVRQWIDNRTLIKKLFDEIAPRFAERPGGYLRITKLGPRKGDGAEMAVLELVDREAGAAAAPSEEKSAKAAKKKASSKRGAKKGKKKTSRKAAAPAEEVEAEA
jgi:large subunit ribosomal protein L17